MSSLAGDSDTLRSQYSQVSLLVAGMLAAGSGLGLFESSSAVFSMSTGVVSTMHVAVAYCRASGTARSRVMLALGGVGISVGRATATTLHVESH